MTPLYTANPEGCYETFTVYTPLQRLYVMGLEGTLQFPVYPEKGPDSTGVFAFSCTLYTEFCKISLTPVFFVHGFLEKLKCFFKSYHRYKCILH